MAKADKQNSPYSELSRKLKGSDYGSAIDTLQTDLGLLEASGAEMEALLIYIVNKCYRQKSYNVDITLMALGLLDGYNNRLDRLEPIEERDLYSERRDKFLKETNYIAIKYGDQAKTYEEAKQTLVKNQKSGKEFPLIERIRNSLNSSTTNCLVAVLTKLYKEKATINVYLEKAKKDFKKRVDERELGDIDWSEDHISPQLLPSLKYYGQSPEGTSLSQPCDTMKNSNFIDKKDSTEATRVIAQAPIEPAEPDSEPSAEQRKESAPEPPSEPPTSVHDLTPKPTPEPPVEPTQELALEPISDLTREQPVNATSEPTPVSPPEPRPNSVEGATQELPPKPTQELPNSNDKKGESDPSSKPNKRIAIVIVAVAVLLVVTFVVFLFVKYRSAAMDPVEAPEGGGIVNPDEINTESNMSMTYQSSSGIKVDINISGISETANVSVDSDTEDGKIIISLNEYYSEGLRDAAIEDFSTEGDGHENID